MQGGKKLGVINWCTVHVQGIRARGAGGYGRAEDSNPGTVCTEEDGVGGTPPGEAGTGVVTVLPNKA